MEGGSEQESVEFAFEKNGVLLIRNTPFVPSLFLKASLEVSQVWNYVEVEGKLKSQWIKKE